MKRFFASTEKKANFKGFEVLTSSEMLKVRGGVDTKPGSRDKDLLDEDTK
jgi:hypothetical protein